MLQYAHAWKVFLELTEKDQVRDAQVKENLNVLETILYFYRFILIAAPSSACRNIQAIQRTATHITLRWKKPISTGRTDFYYRIEYSDGETTGQHSIESRLDYIQETVTGLKPDTTYRFTVTVNNGVSDRDTRNENLRSCELTTKTMEGS